MFEEFKVRRQKGDHAILNKLWVETPFPVSNSVWAYFVFEHLFPEEFDFSYREEFGEDEDLIKERNVRALNRTKNGFEITDGQNGFYWKHAYIPDEKRPGLSESTTGLIYVPDLPVNQSEYLDQIRDKLLAHEEEHAVSLGLMNTARKETIGELISILLKEAKKVDGVTNTRYFLSQFYDSVFKKYANIPKHWARGSPGIDALIPHYHSDIKTYTAHEFMFYLDKFLHETDREQLKRTTWDFRDHVAAHFHNINNDFDLQ